MTSAFWGGFAQGVGKQRDQEYADAQEEKKMRLAEQLKAEYLAKIVDSDQTTYEGDFEVKRNSTGVEISRRQLAADEIAARKLARDKDTAITEGAIATAGVAKKGLEYYDADRQAELDDKEAGRAIQRGNLAVSQGQLANQGRGLDNEERRLNNSDEEKPIALLFSAGDLGDTSAALEVSTYQAELSAAKTPAERRAIVAKYSGIAADRLRKAQNAHAIRVKETAPSILGTPRPLDNP